MAILNQTVSTINHGNPLQSEEGQTLMKELDTISNPEEFMKWRSTFVEQLETFLGEPQALEKARAADKSVLTKMPKVQQAISKIEGCIDEETGKLNEGVKSQMAINKLKESCQDIEKRLDVLMPTNSTEIQKCGYSKWSLAAVLVKDGFLIYNDMMYHLQSLPALVTILEESGVDRQIIDSMQYYCKRIRGCIAVLEDLGLLKVLTKTRAFVPDDRERPPSKLAEIQAKVVESAQTQTEQTSTSGVDPHRKSLPTNILATDDLLSLVDGGGTANVGQGGDNDGPSGGVGKIGKVEKKEERRHTINVTATYDPKVAEAFAKKRAEKRALKRTKSWDPTKDLEKTEKPKGKMILPGNSMAGVRGRGVGRTLSKEESREVKMSNPNADARDITKGRRRMPPKRSKTMPSSLPSGDRQQQQDNNKPTAKPPRGKASKDEDPPPETDDSKQEKNEEDKAKPKKKKSPPSNKSPAARSKPANNGSGGGPAAAATANGKANQQGTNKKSIQQQQQQQRKKSSSATGPGAAVPGTPSSSTAPKQIDSPPSNRVPISIYFEDKKAGKIHCKTLQVDPTKDTIGSIKKRLEGPSKLEVDCQKLSSKKKKEDRTEVIVYANNEKTLASYSIQKGSEVVLEEFQMEIEAKIMPQKGEKITLDVTPKTTLKEIKSMISEETGLEITTLEVYYKKEELIEGAKTVREFKIQEGSKLVVEAEMILDITVKTMDGKTISLQVNPSSDVLDDVKKKVEKQCGEPASNQKLFMDDVELLKKKGKIFLRDYGIEDFSELYMEPKVIHITVELPDGTRHDLKVSPASDMSEIIEAFVRTGKVGKNAKIKFQGKDFPKGTTVKEMKLIEGSIVKLELEEEEQ